MDVTHRLGCLLFAIWWRPRQKDNRLTEQEGSDSRQQNLCLSQILAFSETEGMRIGPVGSGAIARPVSSTPSFEEIFKASGYSSERSKKAVDSASKFGFSETLCLV